MLRTLRFTAVASLVASGGALALSPEQVFDAVSPSVWAVRGLDAAERPFSYGSGVVVAPGRVVTNCHVLARAKSVQIRRENLSLDARLEHADVERDLCLLAVKGLTAPAVAVRPMAELKVGQRVYAIGNPEKLALTLSEGLISGLRTEEPRTPPIQTSAPISPGSSGGGLFDSEGRLVGITTLIVVGRARIAQNLNFAIPAEWIAEVPARSAVALAKRATPAAAAPVAPAPGQATGVERYRYAWTDRQQGASAQYSVRVLRTAPGSITETFVAENSPETTALVSESDAVFLVHKLSARLMLYEFAPYFPADRPVDPQAITSSLRYPLPESTYLGPWTIAVSYPGWEDVEVPAGRFRAFRVEVRGTRDNYGGRASGSTRFAYMAWYAPAAGRMVKFSHERWNRDGRVIDESAVLLERAAN